MNKFWFTNGFSNKQVKYGFSWTVLFFGCFALFIRQQYVLSLVSFLLGWLTMGLTNIFFAFMANKALAQQLVKEGYWPITEQEKQAKIVFGLVYLPITS